VVINIPLADRLTQRNIFIQKRLFGQLIARIVSAEFIPIPRDLQGKLARDSQEDMQSGDGVDAANG
jgi:hypothetical protein